MRRANATNRQSVGVGASLCVLSAVGLAGCFAGDRDMDSSIKGGRYVTPSDFVAPAAPEAESPTPEAEVVMAEPTVEPAVAADGSDEGEATAPSRRVISDDYQVSHDGLIGQVNGLAIFAEEVLRPVADRLRILGQTKTRKEFIAEGYPIVRDQLAEVVRNELVYAEAESSLSENERMGLRYFIQKMEGDLTRQDGRHAQNRRMQSEIGLDVDEYLELERRRQLVIFKIQNEIKSRVIISWRDIERYYRDHPEEFNPPPAIQLRLIGVDAADAAKRRAVEQELADGFLFEEVARQHSRIRAGSGGLLPQIPLSDGVDSTALTSWPEVDAAARSLEEGEFAGPVIAGDSAIWVYVEHFADGTGRSLYEVQHEIEDRLFAQRYKEEEMKYLSKLFARGNMDDFEQMVLQAFAIAIERWAPPA